jgi:hypothetical protein
MFITKLLLLISLPQRNDKNSLWGETTTIIKVVIANGLPIAEEKSEVLIYPLVTGDYTNRREQQKSMK